MFAARWRDSAAPLRPWALCYTGFVVGQTWILSCRCRAGLRRTLSCMSGTGKSHPCDPLLRRFHRKRLNAVRLRNLTLNTASQRFPRCLRKHVLSCFLVWSKRTGLSSRVADLNLVRPGTHLDEFRRRLSALPTTELPPDKKLLGALGAKPDSIDTPQPLEAQARFAPDSQRWSSERF